MTHFRHPSNFGLSRIDIVLPIICCALSVGLSGCSSIAANPSHISTNVGPTESESNHPVAATIGAITPTPSLGRLPTVPLVPNATPTEDDLALAREWIRDWAESEAPPDDLERPYLPGSQTPVRLGVLSEGPGHAVVFTYFLLGFAIVPGADGMAHVIALAGFEDSRGHRFSMPLHSGALGEGCPTIRVRVVEGREVDSGDLVASDDVTPETLLDRSGFLARRVISSQSWRGPIGSHENECLDRQNTLFIDSASTSEALSQFLICEACTVSDPPGELAPWLNEVPSEFDKLLPYIRSYNVRIW